MKRLSYGLAGVLAAWLSLAGTVAAEDQTQPLFRSYAGAFLWSDEDHNFLIESEVQLPLLVRDPWLLLYRHRETTPFLDLEQQGLQAEALYNREELQGQFRWGDAVRLLAVGGYHIVHNEDRPDRRSAYVLGAGIESPPRTNGAPFYWVATAGTYVDRRALAADWWTDLAASVRVVDFGSRQYLDSTFRPTVVLAGAIESVNDGTDFRARYQAGPEFQFLTANGNRADIQLHAYRNDRNPFFGSADTGVLLGLNVNSALDEEYIFHARTLRQPGWFPLIWGGYDVGLGDNRRVSRFDMNVDLVDFLLFNHRFTGTVWYEINQEHRSGDFDNVAYSVAFGLQTPVGLESVLSHNEPLVAGVDFLHRSDHALNPAADRVAANSEPSPLGPVLANGSLNILPRFRLQTIGWDLPYRDPIIYDRHTQWLHTFDWRVTAGYTASTTRGRSRFAGQLGLNCDVATVQGYVIYVRGIVSAGDETPDWRGELGARRPRGKLFARWENYGMNSDLARGDMLVVGAGVNL